MVLHLPVPWIMLLKLKVSLLRRNYNNIFTRCWSFLKLVRHVKARKYVSRCVFKAVQRNSERPKCARWLVFLSHSKIRWEKPWKREMKFENYLISEAAFMDISSFRSKTVEMLCNFWPSKHQDHGERNEIKTGNIKYGLNLKSDRKKADEKLILHSSYRCLLLKDYCMNVNFSGWNRKLLLMLLFVVGMFRDLWYIDCFLWEFSSVFDNFLQA
jgi:hypothetical protein